VFYLRFKVYALHCVLATQARVYGPGRTGCTEPSRAEYEYEYEYELYELQVY
jgi:hypothetical protein